jgi:peptide/nickel transport system permease protein
VTEPRGEDDLPEVASRGFWAETWRRFRKQRRSMMGLAMLAFLALVGFFAPFVAGTKPVVCKYKGHIYFPAMSYYVDSWENPIFLSSGDKFRNSYPANLVKKDPASWAIWPIFYADPYRKSAEKDWRGAPGFEGRAEADNNQPPSWSYPFGTDELGRSVLARMVHGTQIALLIGLLSMGIATAIGLTFGALAGYTQGRTDMVVSRFMEVVQSVPTLILILALIAIVEKPTIWKLMAVIGGTGWIPIARLTRGEFVKLMNLDYVIAARALGLGHARIVVRHVLPNALAPALVQISFGIAGAILTEAGLSLLGFGVQPPTPSWGAILHSGMDDYTKWWLILFPGIAVFVAVFTYNLLADGLQQASDPRLR